MAVVIVRLPTAGWPRLDSEFGRRTERGWEHVLRFKKQVVGPGADGLIFELRTPELETCVLCWFELSIPLYAGPDDGWSNLYMVHGFEEAVQFADSEGWEPIAVRDLPGQSLLPIAQGPIQGAPRTVWLPDMKVGVFHSGSRITLGMDTPTDNTSSWWTQLDLCFLRIPLAKPRAWTEEDMARAVEATDELSRRVT